jgi:singapore isolate B (sub-type 7) whole genome shotgun sequence assembly, scaffold_7
LKEAGIRLEDTPNGTTWKKISKEELKAEEEEKRKKEEEKRMKEEEAQRMEKEREEKAKIDPKTMFLGMTDLYSQFDANVREVKLSEC